VIEFIVNNAPVSLDLPEDANLLDVLRNHLGLFGPRFGCGAEQCGCCMVLVDDEAVTSCSTALDAVAGRSIRTVEGLGSPEAPHPLQAAFLEEQAGQCGYCLSGMLVALAALLKANPAPDEDDVRSALEANLCRCGSHNRIIRAVLSAAEAMRAAPSAVANG
jgi:nicotinate dehydrogenase subunit A